MAEPVLDIDQSGDLAIGYFYEIDNTFTRHPVSGQAKDWIVNSHENEERFVWTPGGPSTMDRRPCSRDKSHQQAIYYTSIGLDLCGGDTVGPFVPAPNGMILVSEELARRLREAGLNNFRATPASIDLNQSACKDPKIYLVVLQGRDAVRWAQIWPETANRCPYCAHGPLVCPECGFWYAYCAQCGKKWVRFTDEKKEAPSDKRIRIESPQSTKLGSIIEAGRWDGSDFMPYCIVTHRVVDLFIHMHAAPLRARPLRVNLRNITKEKKELLERAREPLN